MKDIW